MNEEGEGRASVVMDQRFSSAESRDSTCAAGAKKQTKQECPLGEVRLTQLPPRLSAFLASRGSMSGMSHARHTN